MSKGPASEVRDFLARLARAVHLDAERVESGEWSVSGGEHAHAVNKDATDCDCTDHAVRGGLCKHILCARLYMGDRNVLQALRALVPARGRSGLTSLLLLLALTGPLFLGLIVGIV